MKWKIEKTKDRRVPEFPVELWIVCEENCARGVCCYTEDQAKMVCDALNEKEIKVMKWIDVNEQMPDDDIEVLVAMNGKDWCFASHDADLGWVHEGGYVRLTGVTHWMDFETPEVKP
jgi:hypothetical protein